MVTRQNEHLQFETGGATYAINQTYEPLASDPTGGGLWAGRKWYNTTDNMARGYDGSSVRDEWAGVSAWKEAVRAASTGDVDATSAPATIDGVTLAAGDRVLLKDQATAAENGIYVFNAAGSALTRATDLDSGSEAEGAMVFVQEGTSHQNQQYGQIEDGVTIGTSAQSWTLIGPSSGVANATDAVSGVVELATDTEAIAGTDTSRALTAANLTAVFGDRSGFQLIGDTTAGPFTFPHNVSNMVANERLIVQIEQVSTGDQVMVKWDNTTTDITVTPIAPVASNDYRVTWIKAS